MDDETKSTEQMPVRDTLSEEILAIMEEELPKFFRRRDIEKLTHGLIRKQLVSSACGRGEGPRLVYMGRMACVMKTDFLDWVRNYYGKQSGEYSNLYSYRAKGGKKHGTDDTAASGKLQVSEGETSGAGERSEGSGERGGVAFEEPDTEYYDGTGI